MTTKRSWSSEEDQELLSCISQHKKREDAFKAFHVKYPSRTLPAIRARWYITLRLDNNVRVMPPVVPKKKNCIMMLIRKVLKKIV